MEKQLTLKEELEYLANYSAQKETIIKALEYMIPETLEMETNSKGQVTITFAAEK